MRPFAIALLALVVAGFAACGSTSEDSAQTIDAVAIAQQVSGQQAQIAFQESVTVGADDSLTTLHGFGPEDLTEIKSAVADRCGVTSPITGAFDTPRELAALIEAALAQQTAP